MLGHRPSITRGAVHTSVSVVLSDASSSKGGGGAPQSAWAYVHGRDERAVVARRRRSPTLPRHLLMSIRLLEVLVDHPAASPVLSLPPRAFNICIITSQSPDT